MLTVITAADSYDLTTADAVKDELDLRDGGVSDSWLARQITVQSKRAAKYLGRTLGREVVREIIRPTAAQASFTLERFPVVDIASLVEDTTTLVEDEDFEVDYEKGIVYRLGSNWASNTKLTVTYTGGYLLPGDSQCNLPEDIQQAVLALVRLAYFVKDRDPTLRSEEGRDLGALEYRVSEMPVEAKELLDPYRSID